jgi:hypothetical protein
MQTFRNSVAVFSLCTLLGCAAVDDTKAQAMDPARDGDGAGDGDGDDEGDGDGSGDATDGTSDATGDADGDTPSDDGDGSLPPDDGCMTSAADLVSDFEAGTAKALDVLAPVARGGTSFFYYNDKTATGLLDPAKVESMPLAATMGGACGMYAFRFSAMGFTTWGAGAGVDFMPRGPDMKKQGFDASAYTGIAFYAKLTRGSAQFFVNLQDMNTHVDGGLCTVESGPTQCDAFGGNVTIGSEWELKTIPFAALKQRGFGKAETAFDASRLVNFRLQAKGDFELWIDQVQFVK